MRLIDYDKLYIKLLDIEFPIEDQDVILDAMDDCAVEVPPTVHGRWESHLLPVAWKCSVCGQRMGYNAWKYKYMNYCPNCGAKMDLPDK